MSSFIKVLVMVLSLGAIVPAAQAMENKIVTPEEAAMQQAAAEYAAKLEAVKANRASVIASIVSRWEAAKDQYGFSAGWEKEFQAALEAAPDGQLVAIQTAADYNAVRAILQGRSTPATTGGISIESLGQVTNDLTFTPLNPPCRIIDTRNIGGPIPAGSTRYYNVRDTGGLGGGDACPAPKGEPLGVAINLAAVTPSAAGHLRVWPYSYGMPTVSYLNFVAGQNIANAGIISSCYNCGYDISIYNLSTTHYIADIMGYFYPAHQAAPGLSTTGSTTTIATTCTNYSGGTVTITVPNAGYITVTAQAWVRLLGDGVSTGKYAEIYIGTNATDCTFNNFSQGYNAMHAALPVAFSGTYHIAIPVSRTFYVSSAGTFTYYLNGISDGTATFWYAAMQAHFSLAP
jgi:hypothetical protein